MVSAVLLNPPKSSSTFVDPRKPSRAILNKYLGGFKNDLGRFGMIWDDLGGFRVTLGFSGFRMASRKGPTAIDS